MFFFFLGARESFDSPELERLARVLEIAQSRHRGMTLSMLTTLLRIGLTPTQEGQLISVSDLVTRFPDQTYSTVARQLDLLGDGTAKSPGPGLVEKQADPSDRRVRHVAISAAGRMLLHELDLALSPGLLGQANGKTRQEHTP